MHLNNHAKQLLTKLSIVVICLLCLLHPDIIYANNNYIHQSPNTNNITFHSLPKNYRFRATRAIIKDYKGLMWFGTENGLVKFDGVNLKVYEHNANDSLSIAANNILALFEDKLNNLWIGTSNGLILYNRQNDNFSTKHKVNQTDTLHQTYVSSLSAGSDSTIWVGTFTHGLFAFNIYTEQIKKHPIACTETNSINITCIVPDSINNLWIGTQSGLIYFDVESNHSNWFQNKSDNPFSISSNNISSIEKDCYGNIWVATLDNGLNQVIKTKNTYSFKRFSDKTDDSKISSNAINDLFADKNGNIWIGTENHGLDKLNINRGSIEVFKNEQGNKQSINSNSIWKIYQDNEGRIWIGSYNKGISVIDEYYSKFESYQSNTKTGLTTNDVRDFCETDNGKIWIATDGGGLCRFDINKRSFDKLVQADMTKNTLSNNAVQSIIFDQSINSLWVGSWGGGIDRLSSDGILIKNYAIENQIGIGNNKVRMIQQDKHGNIWVGTNGSGLFLYNKTNDQFDPINYSNILTERAYVSSIQTDSDSTIWIGTLSGLIFLQFDTHKNVTRAQLFTTANSNISGNGINVIYSDNNKNIWLGTNTGGVNTINPHTKDFKAIRKQDGICSNSVLGILQDDGGNMWISTNAGISRIDKLSDKITNYTAADGLNCNEFYSKSCFKTRNGLLLFGSEQGFNLIDPQNIRTNLNAPKIAFTNLRINNTPVDLTTASSPLKKQFSETDTLILNHKQASFSIDFVALNYTRPNQNQFSYTLEGYDDKWNDIGTKTTASYTKVKPGEYTFKVKGANNDGIWNEEPANLIVMITPPLWKTKWAYIMYMLTFFIITTYLFKTWQERIHIHNQLELEKIAKEREHDLNEKNLQFFTNISHEFRTPLSLIIGPVESLLDSSPLKMQEQLKVIHRNSQRLLALTNNLMNLRKMEDGAMLLRVKNENIVNSTNTILSYFEDRISKLKIKLDVNFPESNMLFLFDNEKYTTIMINLLSNAIKYTPKNGIIRISIENNESLNELKISVLNSGKGIHPSELPFVFDKFYQTHSGREQKQFGSGVGLALTKGLVELHGGKIWVTSTPNYETCFTFTLSLNKTAYQIENLQLETPESSEPIIQIDDYEKDEVTDDVQKAENEKSIILIVEDNADLRQFLKKEFEQSYTIILAEDGEKGLQKANKIIPDLIVSDIVMPTMSGIELCKAIKTDIRTSHIPIILLTAKTTTNEQIEGFDTGADAYIGKPFNLKLLQTQIAKLIQSRKELYSRFSQDVFIMARKQTTNEIDQIFLKKTVTFILNNINDNKLNSEILAQLHNMSHRNFYRKIKALTGNTIVEFIKIIRLKQALKLIEENKYSMSEISYMTGFSSPSYFTKTFREYYGKPPSDYLN